MMVAGLKGVQFRKMTLNTTLHSTHTSDDERLKLKTYRAPWMAELPPKTPLRVSQFRESPQTHTADPAWTAPAWQGGELASLTNESLAP